MREAIRIAAMSAWPAVVWAAARLAQVRTVGLAAVPLTVVAVARCWWRWSGTNPFCCFTTSQDLAAFWACRRRAFEHFGIKR
ncbi:hypothetical protein [Nonomuraea sp. NPDC049784]|uniref:hypothetical protein n=1 Tax=Nonomuraea sp. NPDC049784 TaxID=3154361 RepID=UPI0033F3BB84